MLIKTSLQFYTATSQSFRLLFILDEVFIKRNLLSTTAIFIVHILFQLTIELNYFIKSSNATPFFCAAQ